MSNKITSLRKEGKLTEAYNLALELNSNVNEKDIWLTRAFAWVLHNQLKELSYKSDLISYKAKLKEIFDANIPIEEDMFWNAIAFCLRANLSEIINYDLPRALELIQLLDFGQISKSNGLSSLIKIIQKHLKNHVAYQSVIETIGFDKFIEEDFVLYRPKEGRPIMSLVEQVIIAYSKILLKGRSNNGNPFEITIDKEKINTWISKIEELSRVEMQYPRYFKAKLLKALDRTNDAISYVLQFAKSNSNKFWVWSLLAELHQSDLSLQKALYVKALNCGGEEKFLINAIENLASIHFKLGEFDYAMLQIRKAINIRKQNNWTIPNKLNSILKDERVINSTLPLDSELYYKGLLHVGDGLLYTGIEEEQVLITHVNKGSKILNFMKDKTDIGFIKYEDFNLKPEIGQTLSIRRTKQTMENRPSRVFTIAIVPSKSPLLKEVSGFIKLLEGRSFGFVDGIFCPISLLPKGFNEGTIEGIAVPSFDKKKERWSHAMVTITNCNSSAMQHLSDTYASCY